MLSLGVGLTSVPVLGRRGAAYDPDALAFFARLTTQPTEARKKLYSDLIASLKTAGVWAKLDALYILAAADAQAARQNLVTNAYNLTAVNAPTFTADRGYAGDGSGAYLDTGFNAAAAVGAKYAQNSAHVSAWSRTSRAAANVSILGARQGVSNYIDIVPVAVGNIYVGRIQTANTGSTISNTISTGHFFLNRPNSTDVQLYRNGSLAKTDTLASVAPPNASIALLARSLGGGSPDAFTSDQLLMASVGASLSGPESAAFTSALNTYSTAVGA